MVLSIEEALRREKEAIKAEAESHVLRQWYWCVTFVLSEQRDYKLPEPDFSAHWITGDHDTLGLINDYYESIGQPAERETDDVERMLAFINELIGDDLKEFGIELRVVNVSRGFDLSRRIYLLKPGQDPVMPR